MTDDIHAEVREFWRELERTMERNPNADAMADLLGEYRHLSDFINNDDDPEHQKMLRNAVAIERAD